MTDAEESVVIKLLKIGAEERATILDLVGETREDVQAISGRMDLHEQDEHTAREAHAGRIAALEAVADATGKDTLSSLRGTVKAYKARAWGVFASLLVGGVGALAGHYFSTR